MQAAPKLGLMILVFISLVTTVGSIVCSSPVSHELLLKPAAQHGDPVTCARAVANTTGDGSMSLRRLDVEVVESVTRFDSTRNFALCATRQVDVFFNASEFELTSTCFMPQTLTVTSNIDEGRESNSSTLSPVTELVSLACPCAIHEADRQGGLQESVTLVTTNENATNNTLNNSTHLGDVKEPDRFAGLVLSIVNRTIHTSMGGKLCAAPLQPNSTFNASMLLDSKDSCWGTCTESMSLSVLEGGCGCMTNDGFSLSRSGHNCLAQCDDGTFKVSFCCVTSETAACE